MTKYCPNCKNDLDTKFFYRNSHRTDGLMSQCIKCRSVLKKTRYKKSINASYKKLQNNLTDYLKTHSCVDCGNSDIRSIGI